MTVLRPIGIALLVSACASGSITPQSTAPRGSRDALPGLDARLDAEPGNDRGPTDAAPLADRSPPDAAAPMDQGALDGGRIDMNEPGDMAPTGDMASIDMTPLVDMAPPIDMTPLADMAPPVDMAPPDMAIEVPEGLVINEIDYDQSGNDLADFVEILNTAATPAVLDAVRVEFINGDPLEIYRIVPLDGVLASGGRLVLGQQAVLDDLPGGVRGILIADGIQNGAPDAIRLNTPAGPLDGVAYEGDLPGWGEGAGPIAADQGLDVGGSLARCPDGADTDDNATDFQLVPTPTPGAANACP